MAGKLFVIGTLGRPRSRATLSRIADMIYDAAGKPVKVPPGVDVIVHGIDRMSEREAHELHGMLGGQMRAPEPYFCSTERDPATWTTELESAELAFLARQGLSDIDWADEDQVKKHEEARFMFRQADYRAMQATIDRASHAWYALADIATTYPDRDVLVVASSIGAALRYGGGIVRVEQFNSPEAQKFAIGAALASLAIEGDRPSRARLVNCELVKVAR